MPEPIPVTLRKGFTWSMEEMPAEAVQHTDIAPAESRLHG